MNWNKEYWGYWINVDGRQYSIAVGLTGTILCNSPQEGHKYFTSLTKARTYMENLMTPQKYTIIGKYHPKPIIYDSLEEALQYMNDETKLFKLVPVKTKCVKKYTVE